MKRERELELERCVDFHGHLCGGLILGYQAARLGLRRLRERFSPDEELVAVVDNDSCFADAVQALTGCTFGKGNFIFRDFGKMNLTLLSRGAGKGVRLSRKPTPSLDDEEFFGLFAKVSGGTASPAERRRLERFKGARNRALLAARPEDLFSVRPARLRIPGKARIRSSVPCGRCGEPTMSSRLVSRRGRRLCRECAPEARARLD